MGAEQCADIFRLGRLSKPGGTRHCQALAWKLAGIALFLLASLNDVAGQSMAADDGGRAGGDIATGRSAIDTTKPIPLEAINAVENSEWKTALKQLQAYVKREPTNAEGHYLLGKSLFNLKRFAEAKVELRKALQLGKGNNFAARANEMLQQMPMSKSKSKVAPK